MKWLFDKVLRIKWNSAIRSLKSGLDYVYEARAIFRDPSSVHSDNVIVHNTLFFFYIDVLEVW